MEQNAGGTFMQQASLFYSNSNQTAGNLKKEKNLEIIQSKINMA